MACNGSSEDCEPKEGTYYIPACNGNALKGRECSGSRIPRFPNASPVLLPGTNGKIRECLGLPRPLRGLGNSKRLVTGISTTPIPGQPVTFNLPIVVIYGFSVEYDNISYCPHTGQGSNTSNIASITIACPGIYAISFHIVLTQLVPDDFDVVTFGIFDVNNLSTPLLTTKIRSLDNEAYTTAFINLSGGTFEIVTVALATGEPTTPYIGFIQTGFLRIIKIGEEVGTRITYTDIISEFGM
jgi:hypothetical protein